MKKTNVILITHTADPLSVIAAACRLCYSPKSIPEVLDHAWDPDGLYEDTEKDNARLIKEIIKSGHTSVIEHASITFGIEGVSRAMTHQLVRHRIASYSQQSQRYVEFGSDKPLPVIMPPGLVGDVIAEAKFKDAIQNCTVIYRDLRTAGVPAEDARFVLPNAVETKIIVTMNFRALLNFFHERCCNRAQWEIRAVAMEMLKHARNVCPAVFNGAGPECFLTGMCKQGARACKEPWFDRSDN